MSTDEPRWAAAVSRNAMVVEKKPSADTHSTMMAAPGTLLGAMRPAAAAAAAQAGIKIDDAAIEKFWTSVDEHAFARLKDEHGLRFPLRFRSFDDQLTVTAVLALLNAFSGYRVDFHQATGHGVYDGVRRIVMGLYLSAEGDDALRAEDLARVSAAQLAGLLGVATHTETAHPTMPFVTVGTVGGPLHEPLQLAADLCRGAGEFLQQRRHASLASYLREVCERALDAGDCVDSRILEGIAAIPGFHDTRRLGPTEVYLYKKALFLLHALRTQVRHAAARPPWAERLAAHWQAQEPAPLPMFVDNVIPTMLVSLGILDVDESTVDALHGWRPAPAADAVQQGPELAAADAYRVRAAALAAGARMIESARRFATDEAHAWLGAVTEAELDAYLWSHAKEGALRRVPRLCERHTVMY